MRRKAGALISIEKSILEAALALAAEGSDEFYGYQLAKEMREIESARQLVSFGTLYKALDRLEAAGLLQSRWEEPSESPRQARPRRRHYRLTPTGLQTARQVVADTSQVGKPSLREGLAPG